MSIELARLDERRAATLLAAQVPESRAFAGGVAACSGPDTFHNRVLGAGLAGPVDDAELDAMIELFRGPAIAPSIELCPFVDPTLLTDLAARGFVLREIRQLLVCELDRLSSHQPDHPPLGGLEIRDVDRDEPAAVELAIDHSMAGFFGPGESIPAPPSSSRAAGSRSHARARASRCSTASQSAQPRSISTSRSRTWPAARSPPRSVAAASTAP